MGLRTSYGSANADVEEALAVTYSKQLIHGSWSYVSANVSGWYTRMFEWHRYARKSFKFVGMTLDAAKKCRDDMVALFTRKTQAHVWNDGVMGGQWDLVDSGDLLMADVSLVHDEAGMWSVHVRVNEDDVRYSFANYSSSYKTMFYHERNERTYGPGGGGAADEMETGREG